MSHTMKIMDLSGHRTLTWDTANIDEVKAEFDTLIKQNWHAANTGIVPGEKLTKFDPEATEITVWPQFAGG